MRLAGWSRRWIARQAVARSAAPVRYLLGLASDVRRVGNVHGRRVATVATAERRQPMHKILVEPVGVTVESRRRRHAADGDIQRRGRPARRLCRPGDLRQVPGASRCRGAQRADECRTAQGGTGEACRRLAACVPGETADCTGQHRGAPDRGSPADPHGFAADSWRGSACREQAGCLAAARYLRRRAQRPRAGAERAGRHRGAALGACAGCPRCCARDGSPPPPRCTREAWSTSSPRAQG